MSKKIDNYLFLGLPQSGKTVYFSMMAKHLQDLANETGELKVVFSPSTDDFINYCINELQKQKWPAKTQNYEGGYAVEIGFRSRRKSKIIYHDYPGEVFEAAFMGNIDVSPEIKIISKKLKATIIDESTKGIFLILDANAMFTGEDDEKYRKCLSNLFYYINNNSQHKIRVAIIFNKLELFANNVPNLQEIFQKKYGNAFACLNERMKFFNVYSLGEVQYGDKNDDCVVIPAKKLTPHNILDPVNWMLINNLMKDRIIVSFFKIVLSFIFKSLLLILKIILGIFILIVILYVLMDVVRV